MKKVVNDHNRKSVIVIEKEESDDDTKRMMIKHNNNAGFQSVSLQIPNLSQRGIRTQMVGPSDLFREIKDHYNITKKVAIEGLALEEEKVNQKESMLSNLSGKFRDTWKMIQKKILFLSILRISLKETRLFGLFPSKTTKTKMTIKQGDFKLKKDIKINPNGRLFKFHQWVLFLIMIYILLVYPIRFGFKYNLTLNKQLTNDIDNWISDFILSFYFLVDMVLRFLTPVNLKPKEINASTIHTISMRYLKSNFIIDLISLFPMGLMPFNDQWSYSFFGRVFTGFTMFKIVYTVYFHMHYSDTAREKIKMLLGSGKSFRITVSLIYSLIAVHICACLWVSLVTAGGSDSWYQE